MLKRMQIYLYLVLALAVSACAGVSSNKGTADEYNDLSYSFHYKNLDSTMKYALMAERVADSYDDGLAEALNNKAFVYIQRMQYDSAMTCLDRILENTDNQIEQTIADVQCMRLCQRRSLNKEFYDYRKMAGDRIRRISEEESLLDQRLLHRYIYAYTEYNIVNSVYYYYVGLEDLSDRAISKIDHYKYLRTDTAQFLNYLYQKGSQGKTPEDRTDQEVEKLMRCYFMSSKGGYHYWKANALQMLAECFSSVDFRDRVNTAGYKVSLGVNDVPEELFAGYLANMALDLFINYGDAYQVAGTYRTLSTCYSSISDYESALFCLDKALNGDTVVNRAPDLVAGIREQMSVVYAALGDKQMSDYNRNQYLDLQEMTRQDRKYEARAEILDTQLTELNFMIAAVVSMIVVVIVLLYVFNRLRRRSYSRDSFEACSEPVRMWQDNLEKAVEDGNVKFEETGEKCEMEHMKVVKNKRRAVDNRAKIQLASSVPPLIERMLNEVRRIKNNDITAEERNDRLDYVSQLADEINEYNSVLTQWVELRRGMIGLNVESFRLQDVFNMVAKGSMAFRLKGIDLNVHDTDAVVKADRVLTLFMINTIADNSKKHTASGGRVDIEAVRKDGCVDISVSDTGSGMTEEELAGVFDRDISGGHGFGLSNCRGIIEKYKKTSRIFAECSITAESEKGRGSRFTFRLPAGLLKTTVALIMSVMPFAVNAEPAKSKASAFADSVYFCNVEGYYDYALEYADSVVKYLNIEYRKYVRNGKDTMAVMGDMSYPSAEIRWLRKDIPMEYSVILDVRNELAVTALAVYDKDLYVYNNKAYTGLFKDMSADKSLPAYCKTMKNSKEDKTIAVILLVILLLSVFPAYYFLYYRHFISRRLCIEKIKDINRLLQSDIDTEEKLKKVHAIAQEHKYDYTTALAERLEKSLKKYLDTVRKQNEKMETAEDAYGRAEYENERLYVSNSITDNCLSTLKHETMYYPARIKQLAHCGEEETDTLNQMVEYYRDIYNTLMVQAMQQTGSMVFDNRKIKLSEVSGTDSRLCTCGDKDMFVYMFEILRKNSTDGIFNVYVSELDDRYIIIDTDIGSAPRDIFKPCSENIPYLICRQIVRDHSEATGMRACGIDTVGGDDGNTIIRIKITRC